MINSIENKQTFPMLLFSNKQWISQFFLLLSYYYIDTNVIESFILIPYRVFLRIIASKPTNFLT